MPDTGPSRARLSRDERHLLVGQAVSLVGDFVALPVLVLVAAQRGPVVLSVFLTAYFLPRCLQPVLGALADRFDARRIALAADAGRALLFAVLFLYPSTAPAGPWLAGVVAIGLLAATYEPARLKIMGAICRDFAAYNRLFKIGCAAASVAALGLALVLERAACSQLAFLVNAATFLVSFASLVPLGYRHASGDWRRGRPLAEAVAGVRLLLGQRAVLAATGLIVLVDFMTGVLYQSFPVRSEAHGLGAIGTYVLFFSVCLGNGLGASLMPARPLGERTAALLCLLAAACVLGFLADGPLGVLLAFSVIFFAVQMIAITHSENTISCHFARGLQGRLFALNESLPYLALSLGGGIAGALGPAATAVTLLGVAAIAVAVGMAPRAEAVRA